jgi:hypothetical protein
MMVLKADALDKMEPRIDHLRRALKIAHVLTRQF